MNFENVNTISLRNSINSCIESINYSKSEEILSKISNNDIWSTNSRKVLTNALTNLINDKYKKLENKLNNYLQIVDLIEEYQKLSSSGADSSIILNEINSEILQSDDATSILGDKTKEINENEYETLKATIKAKIEGLI